MQKILLNSNNINKIVVLPSEDGSSMFFWNTGTHVHGITAQQTTVRIFTSLITSNLIQSLKWLAPGWMQGLILGRGRFFPFSSTSISTQETIHLLVRMVLLHFLGGGGGKMAGEWRLPLPSYLVLTFTAPSVVVRCSDNSLFLAFHSIFSCFWVVVLMFLTSYSM